MKVFQFIYFIVIIGLGVGMLVPSVLRSMRCKEKTVGKVIEIKYVENSDDPRQTLFRPVVQYEVDGTSYEAEWGDYSTEPQYKEGDKLNLRYNAKKPAEFVKDQFFGLTGSNIGGLFILIIFAPISGYFWIISRGGLKKQKEWISAK